MKRQQRKTKPKVESQFRYLTKQEIDRYQGTPKWERMEAKIEREFRDNYIHQLAISDQQRLAFMVQLAAGFVVGLSSDEFTPTGEAIVKAVEDCYNQLIKTLANDKMVQDKDWKERKFMKADLDEVLAGNITKDGETIYEYEKNVG